MTQETLSIIKPDAVKRKLSGHIIADLEAEFDILGMKQVQLSTEMAKSFYEVHKDKPFFGELVDFMTSGPVVVLKLSGENAITRYRALMGATNPEKAEIGTLRNKYAKNLQENSVHGSDSEENAKKEVSFFF